MDSVSVNLEASFSLFISDSDSEVSVRNVSATIPSPVLTPPPPPTPSPSPSQTFTRRRRSSSGRTRCRVGGPYLAGDGPSQGNGPRTRGRATRRGSGRVRTRGGNGRGGPTVDLLGLPRLSDRICKTCEMGYDDNDITHCERCGKKLHLSCYGGDGCRNCNYDPNN